MIGPQQDAVAVPTANRSRARPQRQRDTVQITSCAFDQQPWRTTKLETTPSRNIRQQPPVQMRAWVEIRYHGFVIPESDPVERAATIAKGCQPAVQTVMEPTMTGFRMVRGMCASMCAAIVALAMVPAAHAASSTATLRVVHGIPGRDVARSLDPALPVDVLVNGSVCIIEGQTFGTTSVPFTIPAASYQIAVSLSNSLKPCGNPAVINARVDLASGEEAVVVAALSPSGTPTAYPFAIDLSPIASGKVRLLVAHTADAPPVDVAVNGTVAMAGLRPGHLSAATVPSGTTLNVTVAPAGSTTPVIGPVAFTPDDRSAQLIFAVGAVSSGSIQLIATRIHQVF